FGQDIQDAISAPRWLLGRTWGSQSMSLKLEGRFDPALIEALRAAGHEVDVLEDYTELMGHAGALVRYPSGVIEGGSDPRSDGAVAGY
ncbi:MAG: gamma-glutamyltransferase, partial [Rhodospirillaceae bacterium]|nr:gamma-glutamyltransferase [Rhodospirillaceae bacterium]